MKTKKTVGKARKKLALSKETLKDLSAGEKAKGLRGGGQGQQQTRNPGCAGNTFTCGC